jgi:tetratricopeptide (TPR) repeat protein
LLAGIPVLVAAHGKLTLGPLVVVGIPALLFGWYAVRGTRGFPRFLTEKVGANRDYHLQCGNLHLKKGRYEKALASFTKAAEADPENADAHAGRAAALHALGLDAEALEACNEAIRRDPECGAAYQLRGTICQEKKGPGEGAEDLEKARQLAKTGPEGFRRALAELTPRLLVTPALVAVNVLVFLAMVASGVGAFDPSPEALLAWGAGYTSLTARGEWWRLLTSNFLHFGLLHLAMNMWVLWDAGRLVERAFGNAGFLVLCLASGLLGSVTSHFFNPDIVCAGASGAVFGVYGALLGFLLRCRGSIPAKALQGLTKSGATFLAYNLLYGFTHQGIDVAAHVGGLGAGFLCGVAMALPLTREALAGRRVRTRLVAAGAAVLVLLGSAGIARLRGGGTGGAPVPPLSAAAAREFDQAVGHFGRGQYDQAIARLDRAIQLEPKYAPAYYNRGLAYHNKGDLDAAMRDYTRAIELDPKLASAYANRGGLLARRGEHDAAIRDYTKAIELDRQNAAAYIARGVAYFDMQQYDRAVADYTEGIRIDPKNAVAYYERGIAYLQKGQLDAAIRDFTQRLDRDRRNPCAFCYRGFALGKKGNEAAAKRDYADAVRLDQDHPKKHCAHGLASRDQSRWDDMILELSIAIGEMTLEPLAGKPPDPDLIRASYETRAWGFLHSGDLARADADAHKALTLDPKSPWARLLLFRIEAARGRADEAAKQAREWLKEPSANADAEAAHLALRYFLGEVPLDALRKHPRWRDFEVAIRGYTPPAPKP